MRQGPVMSPGSPMVMLDMSVAGAWSASTPIVRPAVPSGCRKSS